MSNATAARLTTIAACRADLAQLGSSVPHASSWLMCTCGDAVAASVSGGWFNNLLGAGVALTAFFALSFCLLCCECRGAGKAAKRRKQHKLERQQMLAAQREAMARGEGGGAASGGAEMMPYE